MPAQNHIRPSPPISDPAVRAAFAAFPRQAGQQLMAMRRLIFDIAATTEGVGPLTECLKWGEPAYLTAASGSGTTLRLAWKQKTPASCGLYVNCRSSLVDSFRAHFGEELRFLGNRAVLVNVTGPLPEAPLRVCIAMALTYHRDK